MLRIELSVHETNSRDDENCVGRQRAALRRPRPSSPASGDSNQRRLAADERRDDKFVILPSHRFPQNHAHETVGDRRRNQVGRVPLRKGLSEERYVVDLAHDGIDGIDGLHLATEGDYDLVLLDSMWMVACCAARSPIYWQRDPLRRARLHPAGAD
jgi:hypothetical protein